MTINPKWPDVRMAKEEDLGQILELCRQLHAENGQHALNEYKMFEMVHRCLMQGGGIMAVIGESSDLKGALMILLDPVWYSDEFQLLELLNFVRPDARKSTYADQLIEYAKGCADSTTLDLTIGIMSDHRLAAKERLYSRKLPKGGTFFVYKPGRANAPELTGMEVMLPVEIVRQIGRGDEKRGRNFLLKARKAIKDDDSKYLKRLRDELMTAPIYKQAAE
jgi:hypothetical protein